MLHVRGIQSVKHGAVHYAAPRKMVESVAAYLAAPGNDIVAAIGLRVYSKPAKHVGNHGGVCRESALYGIAGSDIRKHVVLHVGEHGAAAAPAAHHRNAVVAAVVEIHLCGNILVAAADNCRLNPPAEKVASDRQSACRPFFHGKVKGQRTYFVERKPKVNHYPSF